MKVEINKLFDSIIESEEKTNKAKKASIDLLINFLLDNKTTFIRTCAYHMYKNLKNLILTKPANLSNYFKIPALEFNELFYDFYSSFISDIENISFPETILKKLELDYPKEYEYYGPLILESYNLHIGKKAYQDLFKIETNQPRGDQFTYLTLTDQASLQKSLISVSRQTVIKLKDSYYNYHSIKPKLFSRIYKFEYRIAKILSDILDSLKVLIKNEFYFDELSIRIFILDKNKHDTNSPYINTISQDIDCQVGSQLHEAVSISINSFATRIGMQTTEGKPPINELINAGNTNNTNNETKSFTTIFNEIIRSRSYKKNLNKVDVHNIYIYLGKKLSK